MTSFVNISLAHCKNIWDCLFRSLNVHVNVAKQMLFAFAEKNKNKVDLVYLVAGTQVQAGAKFSGYLKSGPVQFSNDWKEVGLQMIDLMNGVWNPEAQPFKIQTNGCHLVKNHLKSGQKSQNFKWSSFQMVGTIAIAISPDLSKNLIIWNLNFKKSVFWMVGLQVPTVH